MKKNWCGGGSIRTLSIDDYKKYSKHGGDGYSLITSRSCPNNCSYCINSFYNKLYSQKGKERFFRRRSVSNTLNEIKHAIRTIPGIRFINFLDDHFLIGEDWFNEFVIKYGKEIGLRFMIRATPKSVTENKFLVLKNIGLSVVQIGIQSGCATTHRDIFHRKFNRNDIISAATILHKLGITAMYDFIIGNEFESVKAKKDTIELMMELPKPYIANIFHIIPFPKTDIIKWYKEHNIVPKLDPYKEDYLDWKDDFFAMLAKIVPVTNNELIKQFLEHMNEASCQAEVRRRYKIETGKS